MNTVANEALIPNPHMEPFKVLIGKWKTVGSHRLMPGATLHGLTAFEWIEDGAFLMIRSEIDEPEIPSAITIISGDNVLNKYSALYFDERGISRLFAASLQANKFKLWRDAPGFSQRTTSTLSQDPKTMVSISELSEDDHTWTDDLKLTYSRID